jgi:hypothetical protein
MDIRIGSTPAVGMPSDKTFVPAGAVEAKVLAVRTPRQREDDGRQRGPERRAEPGPKDPAGGRVLVLLIRDGSSLPAGLESGEMRVFLRFAKRS